MSDSKNTEREDYRQRRRKEAFDDLEFVAEDKPNGSYKAADAFDELEGSGRTKSSKSKKKKRRKRRIWPIVVIIIVVIVVIGLLTYPKYAQHLPGKLGNLPIMGNEVTDTGNDSGDGSDAASQSGSTDVVDQNISAVVTNYFSAYVTADLSSLPEYAYPVSDLEEGYISTIAEYVESYNDIVCTRSDGPAENSYFVTVTSSVKLKNYTTEVPEIFYFYIRIDDSGMYIIDNLYSDFNRSYMVAAMDADIYASFTEYLNTESVQETASTVSANQESALSADADLKSGYEELQSAIASWVSSNADAISTQQQESGNDLTNAVSPSEASSEDSSVTESEASGVRYAKTRVNIRKKANTNSKIVTVVNKNKKFTILAETSDGWYKVKFSQGGKTYTGYVLAEYTKKQKNSSVTETEASGVCYAKTGVNVRKRAATGSKVIAVVNSGKKFTILAETSNGWYKVQFTKGGTTYTGYVKAEYTKKKKSG